MGIYKTVNRQRVSHPAEIHQADPIGTSTDSMMPPLFGRACASAHALEPGGGEIRCLNSGGGFGSHNRGPYTFFFRWWQLK